jgi:hemerythrin superfamily protein
VSTDAIVLLRDDHQEIRQLFRRFKATGERARKSKGELMDQILEALTVHTYIENEVMYPETRRLAPELEEEQDWFPQVRKALGRRQLQELGARMIELKKQAPRRPEQPGALKKAVDAVGLT